MLKIAPSILSADFAVLGAQVRQVELAGADYVHVDVMDGHFVPNLTLGPAVVASLRSVTALPLDVHLMIESPENLIPEFAQAGASILTVHQEVCRHLHRVVEQIKGLDLRAGVSINPATPIQTLEEILPYVDLVLLMTVNPGFGGQSFIPTMPHKITAMREMIDAGPWKVELEVDGGIHVETARKVVDAGAQVLVAGSAIFHQGQNPGVNLRRLRAAALGEGPEV